MAQYRSELITKEMMKRFYDVVIVGAGHGGLQCSAVLAGKGVKVLIVEKNNYLKNGSSLPRIISEQTRSMVGLPGNLVDTRHAEIKFFSDRKQYTKRRKTYMAYTIRKDKLLAHQLALAKNAGAQIMTNAEVSAIEKKHVVLTSGEKVKYGYLVGADGILSIVRKYLNLPLKQTGEMRNVLSDAPTDSRLEYYYNKKVFQYGCGWRFTYNGQWVYGAMTREQGLEGEGHDERFLNWVKEVQGISPICRQQEIGSANYDFRGFRFGRIFLVGDAAGLASPYTGHGVGAAIESGREIARLILRPFKRSSPIEKIVKRNNNFYRLIKQLTRDLANDDFVERRLIAHHFGY